MDLPTLDKCPGFNLYIGGFIALRRPKALKSCRITHIVSVLDWRFEKDAPLIQGYQHLHIPVDDVEDENLLTWFPRSNAFIQEGLDYWQTNHDAFQSAGRSPNNELGDKEEGSGVLIHCAMGKSRSATVLMAYLLWKSRQPRSKDENQSLDSEMVPLPPRPISVVEALITLRKGRPIAEPNEGFMDQLHLWVDMGCPTTQKQLESHKLYKRWMNKRNVTESLRINRAPEMDDIVFEDDNDSSGDDEDGSTGGTHGADRAKSQEQIAPGISAPDGTSAPPPVSKSRQQASASSDTSRAQASSRENPRREIETEIKCRKCRRMLAKSAFIVAHEPPGHRDPSSPDDSPDRKCAHIFLHPLSWMKQTLSEGQLDGRLTCPNEKCRANIGKFAWQGLRCSCGGWVTPGFGVARARVDEAAVASSSSVNKRPLQHQQHQATIPRDGQGGEEGEVRRSEGDDDYANDAGPKLGIGSASGIRMPPGMRKGNL